ncbi:DeoR/GlpR family DNA-binding transcription regulator [Aeromicrobium sp. CTD01-1L150]|uniref:DeoR/GlpR family DNA-binding transcription regulator n=1 Tax=Aeromicrobium sp. CTD01-1L150 TaxID=3341830 RepID=UPI0035C106BF
MSPRSDRRPARAERQRRIVDHVLEQGFAAVSELVEMSDVSVMTVHRDLDDLAGRGLLRRVRGGVSALPTSVFESSSDFRMQRQAAAKESLARAALQFVESGMSVMLDDSTTVLALARLLEPVGPLTVISNYRQALEALRDASDVGFLMLGGAYSRTHDSFIGPSSESGLDSYSVDVVFQSTSTIDTERAYHQEQDVVQVKRAMLRAGNRRVLMIDGTKVGRTSLHHFAHLADFTDVILTPDVEPTVRDAIAEHTTVHVADGSHEPGRLHGA